MAFFLDNLTAIVVGTTLMVGLLFVQQRGQQSAVEATTRYRAQQMTTAFATTVERDVDNVRTQAQTEAAFEGDDPAYRFTLRRATGADGNAYTRQFTFPTLLDPAEGLDSPIVIVTYHVTPTGEQVRIGGDLHPLYQATRHVYQRGVGLTQTGTLTGIVDFDITAYDAGGTPIEEREVLTPTPLLVHVDLVTAVDLPTRRAGDQTTPNALATARHARTVRVTGASSTGGLPTNISSAAGGIPPLPGDDDY